MPIPNIPSLPSIAYASHIPVSGFRTDGVAGGGGGGGGSAIVKVGSFAKSTAAATASQSITGVGFTPKAIIFWFTGPTTLATWTSGVRSSYGFTAGASASHSHAVGEDSGITSTNEAGHGASGATVLTLCSGFSGTVIAQASLTSFDADGFTLSWTTNDASAYQIHYMALGGSALQASVISHVSPATGINVAATGAGFSPDCVLHMTILTGTTGSGERSLGVMDSAGNQWVLANAYNRFGTGTTQYSFRSAYETNKAVLAMNAHSGTKMLSAGYVSMDSDGYTVNYSIFATGWTTWSLCLKGVSFHAGSFAKTTSGAPASQPVTGAGFAPKGLLLASNAQSSNAVAAERIAVGLSDGSSVACGMWQAKDQCQTSVVSSIAKTTKALMMANNDTQTVDSEASLTSLDSDGFTLNWTTNDAVANEMLYLAIA